MRKGLVITYPGGKFKDNYILVGSGTSTEQITVPAGKRWLVFAVLGVPDVNATLEAAVYDDANVKLMPLGSQGAGTSLVVFPDNGGAGELNGGAYPFPLPAGYYIKFTFGAAQGAAAYVGVIVLEL